MLAPFPEVGFPFGLWLEPALRGCACLPCALACFAKRFLVHAYLFWAVAGPSWGCPLFLFLFFRMPLSLLYTSCFVSGPMLLPLELCSLQCCDIFSGVASRGVLLCSSATSWLALLLFLTVVEVFCPLWAWPCATYLFPFLVCVGRSVQVRCFASCCTCHCILLLCRTSVCLWLGVSFPP